MPFASTKSRIDWSGRHFIQARPTRRRARVRRRALLVIILALLAVGAIAALVEPTSSNACAL